MNKSKIASLIFASTLATASTDTSAAQLHSFVPGSSPCAGVCEFDWALEQTGAEIVDGAELSRFNVSSGTIIGWMSWMRNGKAHGEEKQMYVGTKQVQSGEGIAVKYNGRDAYLFKFDDCENWSIVYMDLNINWGSSTFYEDSQSVTNFNTSGFDTTRITTNDNYSSRTERDVSKTTTNRFITIFEFDDSDDENTITIPDYPAPVPVPAGIVLMLSALLMFFGFRKYNAA